jgi:Gas vesicle protein
MNRAANSMIAFVSGTAIGLATGILLAPHKGSATRDKIRNRFDEATRKVEDQVNDQKPAP